MEKKELVMTEGKIGPSLIAFALPLLGSSFIQQLYNTADMIFVGNFVHKQGAAAVGASSLIFTLLIGLFTGVSVGVGVLISHEVGRKNREEAIQTAHTAISFGLVGSLILTALGIIFSEELLLLMNTPSEIMKDSMIYIRIYFLSMLPMVIYNMGSGILRASGDSKTPFYILVIGGLANIAANTLFIVILPWGVAGAAIATCISQGVTAILILWRLYFKEGYIQMEKFQFNLDRDRLKRILHLGLPAGIQAMVITFSNIIVQYYINGYGPDAVAAYATYFKLENILWMPIVSLGQASMTFAGQNTGALKFDRIKQGALISGLLSGGVVIVISVIVLLMPETFFRIFINDPKVIALGKTIVSTTFPFYWFYSIIESAGGSIRGMGYSMLSMVITIGVLCGLRIVLLIVNDHIGPGFPGVAMVYPITWGLTALAFVISLGIVLRKKKSQYSL